MVQRGFSLLFLAPFLIFGVLFPSEGMGVEMTPGRINARSAVLVEVSTGTTLFEQNADEVIEPASFTKVMTLYLVFEALRQGVIHLDDPVYISETAWRTGGSKMFVAVGTRVPLEDLIKGITVVSGNDACVAVAEHIAGSVDAFVEAMNRKAIELKLTKSHFLTPDGLPLPGQVTTARDMAALAVAYLQHFPESLRYHAMEEFTYNNISQQNRNGLLFKDPSVDGLKTGFVSAAGFHLVATSTREAMRLLAVVMGAATPRIREREAAKLLTFGFRSYALVQPLPANQPITRVKVWKGVEDVLDLYPTETASLLISHAQKKSLRWEVHSPEEVTAPIGSQQSIGEVVFYVDNEPRMTVPLSSRDAVGRAGWIKRTWQTGLQIQRANWRWLAGFGGGIVLIVMLRVFIPNRRSSLKRSRYS